MRKIRQLNEEIPVDVRVDADGKTRAYRPVTGVQIPMRALNRRAVVLRDNLASIKAEITELRTLESDAQSHLAEIEQIMGEIDE